MENIFDESWNNFFGILLANENRTGKDNINIANGIRCLNATI